MSNGNDGTKKIQAYEYDVALSFAGEDRLYVEEVAYLLKGFGVKVFYDQFEEAVLWGKDLYVFLQDIYKNKAKYMVMFVSKYYAQKRWTNHERSAAQARAFSEMSEYILPTRFDDTEIPGLLGTTGYIELKTKTPYELVKLILMKLNLQTKNRWFGLWERQSTILSRYGSCRIFNISDDKFDFELINIVGSHIGEINGSAKILSRTDAVYTDSGVNSNGDDKCILKFIKFDDVIQITQTKLCRQYGGARIHFAGSYKIEKDFFWDYLELNDAILSKLYTALLQERYWKIFLLRLSNVNTVDNLDDFDAVAYESGVGSMYTIWECMFMYSELTNDVYGAFLDDDLNICYFSSNPNYSDKQPRTVANWINRFGDRKVIALQNNANMGGVNHQRQITSSVGGFGDFAGVLSGGFETDDARYAEIVK